MLTLFVCADGYYFLMKIKKISFASKEWMTKGICGQAPNCQGGEILKIAQGEYFLEIFLEDDRFYPRRVKTWPKLQNFWPKLA